MRYTLILLCFLTTPSFAEEVVISQKNKKFVVDSPLQLKVGDTVHFKNDDPFFHNIYSLSEAQSFDLGSYPQGESRSIILKDKGTIEIECAIHPQMYMEIIVE